MLENSIHMIIDGWEDDLCNRMDQRIEQVFPQDNSYICSILAQPWMAARGHYVHGGMICTMMDQGLGYLTCAATQHVNLTVSLQVSFLRSIPVGERVFIRAKITKAGKSFIHATGEAWLESDPQTLVATATGVFYSKPTVRSGPAPDKA